MLGHLHFDQRPVLWKWSAAGKQTLKCQQATKASLIWKLNSAFLYVLALMRKARVLSGLTSNVHGTISLNRLNSNEPMFD